MLEVTEDEIIKLKIEDVKKFPTTYASPTAVVNAAVKWKRKPCPVIQSSEAENKDDTVINDEKGFFKRLLSNFSKAKVIPSEKLEDCKVKTVKFVENSVSYNKEIEKHKPSFHEDVKLSSVKSSPIIVLNEIHRLKTPKFYKGSQLYMPNGEQLYWVRYYKTNMSVIIFTLAFAVHCWT